MTIEKKTAKQVRGEIGPLRKLLTRGLPEYCVDGVLDVNRLSDTLGISYQAMYKWFDRDMISVKRITEICALSKATREVNRPAAMVVDDRLVSWSPLEPNDFWAFMGRGTP